MPKKAQQAIASLWRKMVLVIFLLMFWILLPGSVYLWQRNSPQREPVTLSPRAFQLHWQDIQFKTADGLTIAGWYLPAHNKDIGMILAHGYSANRDHMLQQAAYLVEHLKVSVLLIDLRAHGASEGSLYTRGVSEAQDIISAAEYLQNQLAKKAILGAWGFSAGTDAIIQAQGINPHLFQFLVLESPPLSSPLSSKNVLWVHFLEQVSGLDFIGPHPKEIIYTLSIPLLSVAGEREPWFAHNARWIHHNAPPHTLKSLIIVPNAGHGGCWGKLFRITLTSFLNEITKARLPSQ